MNRREILQALAAIHSDTYPQPPPKPLYKLRRNSDGAIRGFYTSEKSQIEAWAGQAGCTVVTWYNQT